MVSEVVDAPVVFRAPDDPGKRPEWREGLRAWRDEARKELGYTGKAYDDPAFRWMQTCRACAKVMMFDREFVDPSTGRFLVESWVARARQQFGDVDALLLWQAYPRIGFDRRNQFDHYREIPGGVKALKNLVERLHALGIKAILAYNPWDTGTRRESHPDHQVMADLVNEAGFDGIFLDTLNEAGKGLRPALDRAKPGVALVSELALPIGAIEDHHGSWAQWFDDSHAPGVVRNRWFERRHMLHMIRRWDTDHTGELHMAWMNGAGMMLWQNIFGSWNGWTERDLAILRSMLPVQKHFNDVLTRGEWTPLVDCSLDHAFASRWEFGGATLWTLVNRSDAEIHGTVLPESSHSGARMFDLIRGTEIDHAEIAIRPRSIGAIVRLTSNQINSRFESLLEGQATRYTMGQPPAARVDPIPVRRSVSQPPVLLPAREMVVSKLPETLVSRMRVRECGDYTFFPQTIYPGLHQPRSVRRCPVGPGFALDRSEVTNRQFREFLRATNYRPTQPESFLAHWRSGEPASEDLDKAVVFVDLDDARAYARWAGLRLPTEDEWQAGVQGGQLASTVWNWTESEHFDGHTSFSILKGGPANRVEGSGWYADGGPNGADWSAKYIHFYPSLDRCETIGFRCAATVDAALP